MHILNIKIRHIFHNKTRQICVSSNVFTSGACKTRAFGSDSRCVFGFVLLLCEPESEHHPKCSGSGSRRTRNMAQGPPPPPSHERAEEVTLPDESARHPVLALKATISSPFIARETQRVHHVNRQVIDSLLCFWWYWQQFCVKVNTGVCMRC